MNIRFALLLVVVFVCGSALAEDQIFKWKDAQGVWHYSSNAPEGVNAEKVSIRHSVVTPAKPTQPVSSEGGAATANTTGGTAAANKVSGPESSNCKLSREAVVVLENNPRVSMDLNGDGVQEPLTYEQHLAELERRRQQAKVYCAE